MENKTSQELSHEHLESARAALESGDVRKALESARAAYEVCPDHYPANYNALSMAVECMEKLDITEEARTLRKTMEKLLFEHDIKPHAEGEARSKHPLRKTRNSDAHPPGPAPMPSPFHRSSR